MDELGSRVRGVDESGAVEVALAADGLPERIRPLAGWARAVEAARAGAAVEEAFAAAHRAHGAKAPEVVAVPPLPPRATAPGWRSGRELMAVAGHAVARVPPDLPVGVGRSASGPVTITLARPSTLRCALDRRWASAVGPAQAAVALAEALVAARRDLRAAVAERVSATTALHDLVAAVIDRIGALGGPS